MLGTAGFLASFATHQAKNSFVACIVANKPPQLCPTMLSNNNK